MCARFTRNVRHTRPWPPHIYNARRADRVPTACVPQLASRDAATPFVAHALAPSCPVQAFSSQSTREIGLVGATEQRRRGAVVGRIRPTPAVGSVVTTEHRRRDGERMLLPVFVRIRPIPQERAADACNREFGLLSEFAPTRKGQWVLPRSTSADGFVADGGGL